MENENVPMLVWIKSGLLRRIEDFQHDKRYKSRAEAVRFLLNNSLEKEGYIDIGKNN